MAYFRNFDIYTSWRNSDGDCFVLRNDWQHLRKRRVEGPGRTNSVCWLYFFLSRDSTRSGQTSTSKFIENSYFFGFLCWLFSIPLGLPLPDYVNIDKDFVKQEQDVGMVLHFGQNGLLLSRLYIIHMICILDDLSLTSMLSLGRNCSTTSIRCLAESQHRIWRFVLFTDCSFLSWWILVYKTIVSIPRTAYLYTGSQLLFSFFSLARLCWTFTWVKRWWWTFFGLWHRSSSLWLSWRSVLSWWWSNREHVSLF